MMRGAKLWGLLECLGLALLVACAPAAPSPTVAPKPAPKAEAPAKPAASAFERLVALSKAEMGKLDGLGVGYDADAKENKPIADAFLKEVPWAKKINYNQRSGREEGEAAYLEIKAGRSMFDALMPPTETRKQWIDEAIVVLPPVPFKEAAAALPESWGKVDPRAIGPNGYWLGTKGSVRGLAWNKNLVPGGLSNWADCLKPEFKGKATIDSRNKQQAFHHDPKYRDWWLNQFLPAFKEIAVIERGQTASLEKIAAGQYAIGCGFNRDSSFSVIDTGAPLGFTVPDPFHFGMGSVLYITKTSKAPATAALYMLFQASDAGQAGMILSNQELPWARGSKLTELMRGKTLVECDEACELKAGDYEKEFARALGLPGS